MSLTPEQRTFSQTFNDPDRGTNLRRILVAIWGIVFSNDSIGTKIDDILVAIGLVTQAADATTTAVTTNTTTLGTKIDSNTTTLGTKIDAVIAALTRIAWTGAAIQAIRASAATTGSFVLSTAFVATNFRQAMIEVVISAGTFAAGSLIIELQATIDGTNWGDVTTLKLGDPVVDLASSLTVVPLEARATSIWWGYPADVAGRYSFPITGGQGTQYRLRVRSAGTTGPASAAPATFPSVAINVLPLNN